MEAVVDRNCVVGLFAPGGERVQERLGGLRRDKIDDGGGATARRGNGAGGEGVGADPARQRQLQVDMRVHRAGEHIAARRVDLALPLQVEPQRGNRLALDADVGRHNAAGRNQPPVFDDQFKHV